MSLNAIRRAEKRVFDAIDNSMLYLKSLAPSNSYVTPSYNRTLIKRSKPLRRILFKAKRRHKPNVVRRSIYKSMPSFKRKYTKRSSNFRKFRKKSWKRRKIYRARRKRSVFTKALLEPRNPLTGTKYRKTVTMTDHGVITLNETAGKASKQLFPLAFNCNNLNRIGAGANQTAKPFEHSTWSSLYNDYTVVSSTIKLRIRPAYVTDPNIDQQINNVKIGMVLRKNPNITADVLGTTGWYPFARENRESTLFKTAPVTALGAKAPPMQTFVHKFHIGMDEEITSKDDKINHPDYKCTFDAGPPTAYWRWIPMIIAKQGNLAGIPWICEYEIRYKVVLQDPKSIAP